MADVTTSGRPVEPLSSAEEAAWRALARAIQVIPRVLEADLFEAHGLSGTEYAVLAILAEATNQSMRMTQLANRTSLTGSGMTRVVDRLSRQELVQRVRADADGRGHYAVLTPRGSSELNAAVQTHLAGVRQHVMDHLVGLDLLTLTDALTEIASADCALPLRRPRK
jgi:DNA-binding MarR family transcriptional regulator